MTEIASVAVQGSSMNMNTLAPANALNVTNVTKQKSDSEKSCLNLLCVHNYIGYKNNFSATHVTFGSGQLF